MRKFILFCLALTLFPLPSGAQTKDEQHSFLEACYLGAALAQVSLSNHYLDEDHLRTSTFACQVNLDYLTQSHKFPDQERLTPLACGVGVGASFASYGRKEEVLSKPPSTLAMQLANTCIDHFSPNP
jgi:hypothetical protein